MKVTELILQLHTVMLEKGNLDVYVHFGCGCCDEVDDPEVRVVTEEPKYSYDDPPGIYLN